MTENLKAVQDVAIFDGEGNRLTILALPITYDPIEAELRDRNGELIVGLVGCEDMHFFGHLFAGLLNAQRFQATDIAEAVEASIPWD